MPDMAYESGVLRSGGSVAQRAAGAAETALTRLRSATITAGPFGEFDGAARLATGLGSTRDEHARMAHAVHARHTALHGHALDTATQGERLVGDTTAAARTGAARTIVDGMSGRT
jgi:hypothetical protein